MSFAKRRDANERLIVDALRAYGCAVQRLNEHGVPDLLVSCNGVLHLVEVKMPLGPKGGADDRTLTERQVKWWADWNGKPPVVVHTVDEALEAVGAKQ